MLNLIDLRLYTKLSVLITFVAVSIKNVILK